ncbi:hypothetical protein D3C73_658550 [compost metagenome]
MPRQFQVIRDHQCQGLSAVQHSFVVQGPKRRSFGRIRVFIGLVVAGNAWPIGVVDHRDHAGQCQGFRSVDADHPAAGDIAGHHTAMKQPLFGKLPGITCLAGDLEAPVDAIHRLANRLGLHQACPPFAAVLRARMMARRASATLKAL